MTIISLGPLVFLIFAIILSWGMASGDVGHEILVEEMEEAGYFRSKEENR